MMKTDRRNFIRLGGLAGLSSMIPTGTVLIKNRKKHTDGNCVLIPSETAGPFPLDLTENSEFFRQDIREDREGAELRLRMIVQGMDNCEPMPNVRVNVWHCDQIGRYSGYDLPTNPGQEGLTYLRGFQWTDVQGIADFVTIFPGWYPGRTAHIHFQVWVSSMYQAVSQLTWEHAPKQDLYNDFSDIYTEGVDPLAPENDGIFVDGFEDQLATLSWNEDDEVYESELTITVLGEGMSGVGHIESQTAQIIELGQNTPNPYADKTTLPFILHEPAEVRINIWSLQGQRVAKVDQGKLIPGSYRISFNPAHFQLSTSTYVYELQAMTDMGTFRTCKVMTKG